MTVANPLRPAICLVFALLAGCAATDPYRRPGMWQPDGVNDGNIAAMAQDPRDLIRGSGDRSPELRTGAGAVDRLWQDKLKPLPGNDQPAQGGGDAAPPAVGAH